MLQSRASAAAAAHPGQPSNRIVCRRHLHQHFRCAPACAPPPPHRSSRAPAACRRPEWRRTRGWPSAWGEGRQAGKVSGFEVVGQSVCRRCGESDTWPGMAWRGAGSWWKQAGCQHRSRGSVRVKWQCRPRPQPYQPPGRGRHSVGQRRQTPCPLLDPPCPHLQRAGACGSHALVHVLVQPQQHKQALVAVAAGQGDSKER